MRRFGAVAPLVWLGRGSPTPAYLPKPGLPHELLPKAIHEQVHRL